MKNSVVVDFQIHPMTEQNEGFLTLDEKGMIEGLKYRQLQYSHFENVIPSMSTYRQTASERIKAAIENEKTNLQQQALAARDAAARIQEQNEAELQSLTKLANEYKQAVL